MIEIQKKQSGENCACCCGDTADRFADCMLCGKPLRAVECKHYPRNRECLGRACPYFPGNH